MLALQDHYDGKSWHERRKQVAKDDLKKLFYRNETPFSFEKYLTNMKQKINMLENYNVPLYEAKKVRKLFDNINSPKQQFEKCG